MEQNCLGERYIGCGARAQTIELDGTPGNALGAYLDGADIIVRGNAQDATGDTMNAGSIIIHGSTGDAAGYAMRGGSIYVRDGAGYRAGIHMKAYKEKLPVIVVGDSAGSFLGEYQAGGVIVVFALDGGCPVGNFCGTGM
ncbi:MAG: glutamate synthase, partial [Eubacteriales bacterium]